mmetsp:Transcript_21379/g.55786  ORF Transcript_21379/g.55786 Transcript_21379/m.55786 type:complete len:218 (-) Transcript_21379:107-760(-)
MVGAAATIVQWYARQMAARPLRTSVATAVPMMVAGDCVAQRLEGRATVDPARTVVMATYSGLVFTPVFFNVFRYMDRAAIFKSAVLRGPRGAIAKAAFCVGVAGPPVNAAFLTIATTAEMVLLDKKAKDGAALPTVLRHKLISDLPHIMMGSLAFWVPTNTLIFTFIPPSYRVLGSSLGACVWNCYLSMVQHEFIDDSDATNESASGQPNPLRLETA